MKQDWTERFDEKLARLFEWLWQASPHNKDRIILDVKNEILKLLKEKETETVREIYELKKKYKELDVPIIWEMDFIKFAKSRGIDL